MDELHHAMRQFRLAPGEALVVNPSGAETFVRATWAAKKRHMDVVPCHVGGWSVENRPPRRPEDYFRRT